MKRITFESKPQNKVFEIVWAVRVSREEIEKSLPEGLNIETTERMVHDLVYLQTLNKMQAGDPDSITWMDENGRKIYQLTSHHTMGVVAGVAEPVDYESDLNWEEEALLMMKEEKSKG